MSSVLILGSSGMLGRMCSLVLSELDSINLFGTSHLGSNELITERTGMRNILFNSVEDDINNIVNEINPEYIINCIGRTKPAIDEQSSESIIEAIMVNSLLPKQLEKISEDKGTKIIQIGTDCVFSGKKGNYTVEDNYDPEDIYGQTKSLGEFDNNKKMLIRTSIIGPEMSPGKFLFNWFFEQDKNAELNGFNNHDWNGVTTLAFAKIVKGVINNEDYAPKLFHLTPRDLVNKFQLLNIFKESFDREDISVNSVAADTVVDRTLVSTNPEKNKNFWLKAGYKDIPSIEDLVVEMSESDYTKILMEK